MITHLIRYACAVCIAIALGITLAVVMGIQTDHGRVVASLLGLALLGMALDGERRS